MRVGRLDRRSFWAIWRTPLAAPQLNGSCGDWVSGSATTLSSDNCYAQLKLFNHARGSSGSMFGVGDLTRQFGRYGYRMITGLLNNAGWHVSHRRVERIWRREGLKVPQKQAKKGRLWLNDGSCVRLRPEHPNHVWSYDFVQDRTHDGRIFRTLNITDEFTKEELMIRVKRKLNSTDVVDALTDLFILRGPPRFIRSDNGAEFIAEKVRAWIAAVGAKTAFIEPGSPWENGYCESFNARFRPSRPI